jgi:hypothetical protein
MVSKEKEDIMKPKTFASLAYDSKKKKTRREQFLEEMDRVIPWEAMLKIIRLHYPKAGNGRPPMEPGMMLRIYFLQQWYGLSDPTMEDSLYDSECAIINEEPGAEKRPGDETDEEREPVVFRDESACGDGYRERISAQRRGNQCCSARFECHGSVTAWRRKGCVRRQSLCRRRQTERL